MVNACQNRRATRTVVALVTLVGAFATGSLSAQLRPTLLRPNDQERVYERRGLRITAESRDNFASRSRWPEDERAERRELNRRNDVRHDVRNNMIERPVSRERIAPRDERNSLTSRERERADERFRPRETFTRTGPVRPNLEVREGAGTLPNDDGQVWREYNLQPYTRRVQAAEPEFAVLDWIRRETGDDVWNSGPLSVLWANETKLVVYHTPEVQRTVANLLDRFMEGAGERWDLSTRLITLESPNWRSRALPLLEPVEARSPGVDAWLMSKENAVVLLSQLRKRSDYQEHYALHRPIETGQSQVIQRYKDREYVRSARWAHQQFGAIRPDRDTIAEGFSLRISPLFDPSNRLIDAVVKCQIDQIEQMVPVALSIPGPNNSQKQRVTIEVPQIVSWRLHERFVWPQDRVLLLSCGVVAAPTKESGNRLPLAPSSKGRADALLFIQSNGTVGEALRGVVPADRSARGGDVRRRY